MTDSNQHSMQADFDTLRSHARAMKTGVWASYAEEVLDAVARIEEQLEALRSEMQFVNDVALSFHKGEEGKARAINVIATRSGAALNQAKERQ